MGVWISDFFITFRAIFFHCKLYYSDSIDLFYIFLQYEEYVKSIDFEKPTPPSVYYMKQTISNACGTVAMLHSVANCLDCIDLDEGILKEFLEKTKDATPEEKAKQLEDSSAVCDVHDTIAKQGQTAVRVFLIVF